MISKYFSKISSANNYKIIIITVPNAFFSLAKVLQAKLVGQNFLC
jgi:hypothetical protein